MSGSQVTYNHNSRIARKMSSLLQGTWTKKNDFHPSRWKKHLCSQKPVFPHAICTDSGVQLQTALLLIYGEIMRIILQLQIAPEKKTTRWTYKSCLLGGGRYTKTDGKICGSCLVFYLTWDIAFADAPIRLMVGKGSLTSQMGNWGYNPDKLSYNLTSNG